MTCKNTIFKYDTTTPLTTSESKHLQKLLVKFLYYTRAIECTMLHAMNNIAAAVTNVTQATKHSVNHFIYYAYNNPDDEIIYRASEMHLQANSKAEYLVAPNG